MHKSLTRRLLELNALITILVISSPADARGWEFTAKEIAMLPAYCAAKLNRGDASANNEAWINEFGRESWGHMHHYCHGLIELNRSLLASGTEKKGALGASISEFDYMLRNTPNNLTIRPDIHHSKGQALKLSGNDVAAIKEFLAALENKPDHVSAALATVSIYIKLGKTANAKEILYAALLKSPNTRILRKRFEEIGGDLSAIDKISSDKKEKNSTPNITTPDKQITTEHKQTPTTEIINPSEASTNTLGTKNNPWCRFCTDINTTKP
jgi:hypothetical protein